MLSTSKRSLALLFVTGMMALPSFAGSNEWQLNMTEGVTSVSKNVYDLHMLILIICCVIGVLVFGVMFYSMFMHRKSRGAQASNFHESLTLEFAWTIVPVIILVAMAIPATSTLKQIYDHEDAELEVLVTGYQWKWKYEYLGQEVSFFSNLAKNSKDQIYARGDKSQNYLLEVDEPLVIPAGVKVRFLVTAADVIHSWWVPQLAVKRDAIPGYVNAAWTKVDEPGVYRGQCAELCGKDHGYMPIEVHVVSQSEFDNWIGEKRQKALEIAEAAKQTLTFDQLIAEGESVYAAQCAACHGPGGEGGVGPAINGSKVATGELAGHLDVVLKGVPGTAMQAFAEQLTPVEAAAVITYQRNAFGNNMGDLVQPIDIVNAKQGQ